MKNIILPFFLFLTLFSCNGDSDKSDENSNSSNDIDTTAEISSESSEPTFFRRSEPGGTIHTSEQIQKDDYWLFRKDEKLFSHPYMQKDSIIGSVKKGTKVKVIEMDMSHLINAEWFVGNPVLVELPDGQSGYMWDHYLVQMPYPTAKDDSEFTGIQWYLNHALYSGPEDSTIYEGEEIPDQVDWEGGWEKVTFQYEMGIRYSESEFYESGENVLFIPKLSIQEGYLLLDALVEGINMIDITEGLPQAKEGKFKNPEYDFCVWSADVEFDEMFTIVDNIRFTLGDGCGEWYVVREVDGGVELELGSGC